MELRTKDGCWQTAPLSNTLYTTLQILLYYYLNRQGQNRAERDGLRQYLLNMQAANGSWISYVSGSVTLGLTVLNYFTLSRPILTHSL